jgi:chaperone required for assembly of F1-ATPase
VPTRALAEAIAAEWNAQGQKIEPASMPMQQLANTAIDRVAPDSARVVAETVAYAETDLTCHWASEPAELIERQRQYWQPLLDWLAVSCDAPLQPVTGIVPIRQSPAAVGALRTLVRGQDPFRLTGLHYLTTVTGSLVIALSVFRGHLDPEGAWAAAQLDENFQIERWGEDPLATQRRRGQRAELEAAFRFLTLLRV